MGGGNLGRKPGQQGLLPGCLRCTVPIRANRRILGRPANIRRHVPDKVLTHRVSASTVEPPIRMDLNFTPEQESFRAEVRAFLEVELPVDIRDKMRLGRRMRKDDMMRWQKILYRRGWGAGMWPKRFGGAGWSVVEQHIFEEEGAAAYAPPQIPFSLRMVAPVLMTFANAAQQEY